MKRRGLNTMLSLAAAACLPACGTASRATGAGGASKTAVYECTFLRAQPEQQDRLARFIRANWFAMDLIAQLQGLMNSYELLEPRQHGGGDDNTETHEWDLLIQVGYPTAGGYRDIADAFEAIRRAHTTVLIDGLGFRALGRIVKTSAWVNRSDG
jgi:hypothetical protein